MSEVKWISGKKRWKKEANVTLDIGSSILLFQRRDFMKWYSLATTGLQRMKETTKDT